MSNFKWSGNAGNASYVLDIATTWGFTQMFLGLFYGASDPTGTGLTLANANGTASAMQTAVNGLTGVTGSTLTTFNNPVGYVLFDSQAYAEFQFTTLIPDSFANPDTLYSYLTTASPVDGILTAADLTTVTTAIKTYTAALPHVVSVTPSQLSVTPPTL